MPSDGNMSGPSDTSLPCPIHTLFTACLCSLHTSGDQERGLAHHAHRADMRSLFSQEPRRSSSGYRKLVTTTLATFQTPHEGLALPFFGSLQIVGPIDIRAVVILNLTVRICTTAYGSDETLCFHSEMLTPGPCSLELPNFLSQLLCTCVHGSGSFSRQGL